MRREMVGHQFAKRAGAALAARRGRRQPAAGNHQYAVGQRQYLVQIFRDQQDRRAARPRLPKLAMHVGHRADVQPAHRLVGEHDLRLQSSARPRMSFLHVAARQEPHARFRRRAFHVVVADQRFGESAGGAPVEEPVAAEARRAVAFRDDVFRDGHVGDRADRVAVLGMRPMPAASAARGDQSVCTAPPIESVPATGLTVPAMRPASAACPIARHAPRPVISRHAGRREAIQPTPAARAAGRNVAQRDQRLTARHRRDGRRLHLAADHRFGQFMARGFRRPALADQPAGP